MKQYSGLKNIPSGHVSGELTAGCLVIEGGAMRGVYNAGAADALLTAGIHLQSVIGVSAGAPTAQFYAAGEIGRVARVNLGYRNYSRYMGIQGIKESGSLINLDFALYEYEQIEPLDHSLLYAPERRIVVAATNCLTGEPEYFENTPGRDVMEATKASATMPFAAHIMYIDGVPYLDGGCACDIPLQWALDEKYEKIVVIRTREREFRRPAVVNIAANIVYGCKFPEFADTLAHKNFHYNELCDRMIDLEREGRIFVLAPDSPTNVGRFEFDVEKMGALYRRGYYDTLARADELKEFLAK